MAEDKEGFLARWSKRKQAQLSNPDGEPGEETPAVHSVEVDEEQLQAERAEAEANRLAAEAVDLDEVGYGFDFSIFMKRGVPELLRKKALQKFFNSSPVLANLDGLNDYDEDFNNPLHMVYKSTWDVGRGFLTEAEKVLQQATGRLTLDVPPEDTVPADLPEYLEAGPEDAPAAIDGDSPAEAASAEEAQPGVAEEADAATIQPEADTPPDQEPDQPPQKRVSIRQRLNG
ncbi:DUF3306 domain-containing protein [Hoeflea sp. AS16]|uniref:DUF3306 domain-containing protein n=1 Tax=Hoeflea sp. AS16 TaxID=3135779 RepID=UPI00317C3F8C